MAESEQKVVLLAGASGYVGNLALDALLDSFVAAHRASSETTGSNKLFAFGDRGKKIT